MKKFIFVTNEGQTIAPNENIEIHNSQVIGFAKGMNEEEALKNLLKENSWIWDSGFNVAEFIGHELK